MNPAFRPKTIALASENAKIGHEGPLVALIVRNCEASSANLASQAL